MELGAFSVSLSVKDLDASKAFYEKLGFAETGGGEGYLIMINGACIIGLFQDMFEGNILTFNPGLGQDTQLISDFTDVRDLRNRSGRIRDRNGHGHRSGRDRTGAHHP